MRWSPLIGGSPTADELTTKEGNVTLYIGGGILYLILLLTLGLFCLRKGHWVMFIIGIFIPLFWLIGAVIGPTESAARRAPA